MIWRATVFFMLLGVGRYVYLDHGETAAWVFVSVLLALLLPLSMIVSHLSKIEKLLSETRDLLSKILKGYTL